MAYRKKLETWPFDDAAWSRITKRLKKHAAAKKPPLLGPFLVHDGRIVACPSSIRKGVGDWKYLLTRDTVVDCRKMLLSECPELGRQNVEALPEGYVQLDLERNTFVISASREILSDRALIRKIRQCFRIPRLSPVGLRDYGKEALCLTCMKSGKGWMGTGVTERVYDFPLDLLFEALHTCPSYSSFRVVGRKDDLVTVMLSKDLTYTTCGFLRFVVSERERADDVRQIVDAAVRQMKSDSMKLYVGIDVKPLRQEDCICLDAAFFSMEVNAPKLEQTPAEAEMQILAAIMAEWNGNAELSDMAVALLKPEHFTVPAHRGIFRAIADLKTREKYVFEIHVIKEMKRTGRLAEAGGEAFIWMIVRQLSDLFPGEAIKKLIRKLSASTQTE
ncbi:MAG TPA: DnaB-like helicase N-terminal domain-containing protein [Candidatus Ozemobacteraceae bacterium]|nr:DnaB-like helicase N-terminal domain-containing protein [Candidatus Ozemobacteraceae bacterium]